MTDIAVSTVIDELIKADVVSVGLINGDTGLINSGGLISSATGAEIRIALDTAVRRHKLLVAAIEALKSLEADGYPTVPHRFVERNTIDEVRAQLAIMEEAFELFTSEKIAGEIFLGNPVAQLK